MTDKYPHRVDSEYVRGGTCSIFIWAEPLKGWREPTHSTIAPVGTGPPMRPPVERRLPPRGLHAWQDVTNANQRQVNWQFTTSNSRIKLRHLYPTFWKRQSTRDVITFSIWNFLKSKH